VTLSTGFCDGASWSVRWLPATYPLPFGSSVSASFAGSLSRWLEYVFAYATHRFLLDRVSGLRFPDTAVYPRFSPLRTSRQTGGYAFTSAPEGQGLHLHGDEVTRLKVNLNLAVFPEAKASFRPTGRTAHLVVNRWACDGESGSHRDILCRLDVWTLARRQISWKITSVLSMVWHFTTKSDGICKITFSRFGKSRPMEDSS
jgi:hypothetical protein